MRRPTEIPLKILKTVLEEKRSTLCPDLAPSDFRRERFASDEDLKVLPNDFLQMVWDNWEKDLKDSYIEKYFFYYSLMCFS